MVESLKPILLVLDGGLRVEQSSVRFRSAVTARRIGETWVPVGGRCRSLPLLCVGTVSGAAVPARRRPRCNASRLDSGFGWDCESHVICVNGIGRIGGAGSFIELRTMSAAGNDPGHRPNDWCGIGVTRNGEG